jgi:hypothetical protein
VALPCLTSDDLDLIRALLDSSLGAAGYEQAKAVAPEPDDFPGDPS